MKRLFTRSLPQFTLICLLTALVYVPSLAQTCTAIANGNWTSASTWSCNHAPANGDKIIIPLGKTVTVDAATTTLNIDMDIYGTLNFASGSLFNNKTLTVEMGRTINVFSTGMITGGNALSGLYMVTGYVLVVPIITQIYSGIGSNITGPKSCLLGTCLLNASLPIDLLSFTASFQAASQTIRLDWITVSETNNETFTVERSSDGIHFQPIAKLPGAGTTHQQQHYESVDAEAPKGLNYYRLQQTDFDGTSTYSKMVAVQQQRQTLTMAVSPNPSDGTNLRVNLGGNSPSDLSLLIFDHLGHQVYEKTYRAQESQLISIGLDHPLSNGIYWIKIRQDDTVLMRKLLVHNHQ